MSIKKRINRPRYRLPGWGIVIVIVLVLTWSAITANRFGVAPSDVAKIITAGAALLAAVAAGGVARRQRHA